MGLDNGIEIKRNDKSLSIYDKIQRFEREWDKKYQYDFEVCYWRKCWNVRHRIAMAIGGIYDNLYTPLKRDDIAKIINELKSFNQYNWDDDGGSIWEWVEQEEFIKQHIENLEYVYELMGEHDIDVFFYDSY